MQVLITGHTGFIGPIMVRLFKEAGHTVTGLDIGYFRECLANSPSLIEPDREIVKDVREINISDLDGIDAIVHLAALSNDPLGKFNPTLTHNINYEATVKLAKLAKQAHVERFVMASSCSIYGAAGESGPLDETAPFAPASAYAVSKVQAEAGLSALADDEFSPVFMRNATAFGASPRMRFDLVLNNLVGWAMTENVIRVLSDGTPWRPLVHIEDISRAALCAVEAPRDVIHNQAFNIGRDDCNYQVKNIADVVKTVIPQAEIEITGEMGGDPRSYRVDFTKALAKLPNFEPKWDLKSGCEELVSWIDKNEVGTSEDVESRRFIRLKHLQHLIGLKQLDNELRFVA